MAMNKKEQLYVASLEHQVRVAKAFRFPDYPEPRHMTREEIDERKNGPKGVTVEKWGRPQKIALGWFVNTYQNGTVNQGCSDGACHDFWDTKGTSAQGMGEMFKTKLEALKFLRIKKTEEFAEALAKIDKEIEFEQTTELIK
jgi:hypothetical protein